MAVFSTTQVEDKSAANQSSQNINRPNSSITIVGGPTDSSISGTSRRKRRTPEDYLDGHAEMMSWAINAFEKEEENQTEDKAYT